MKTIHCYIIGCLWAFMMLLPSPSGVAYAQKRKVMNRPYVDQRLFHYGFLAGMHLQDIELEQNGFINEGGLPKHLTTSQAFQSAFWVSFI